MNIRYLEGVPGTEKLVSDSTVLTLATPGFSKKYPELTKFLSQLYVTAKTQSLWIHDYGYKKEDPDVVATRWLKDNPDVWAKWLKGVISKDGRDAVAAVKAAH